MALFLAACSATDDSALDATTTTSVPTATTTAAPTTTSTTTASTTTTTPTTTTTEVVRLGSERPVWLETIELPLIPGTELGVAQPTPPELTDRQLWTVDTLAPPPSDAFVSELTSPPPTDVIARSTWRSECPVGLEDLTYAQVSFYGFDGQFHTGELIVHDNFAESVVDIFAELHAMQFPIEQMVVTTQEAVDAHPTGDSNNTSSFVCRSAVGSGNWSRHAFGGAIDINPFHNPYRKGEVILPELASAYLDRDRDVPGMITPEVVQLFADIGWGWGGNWRSLDDWMHFSDTGN